MAGPGSSMLYSALLFIITLSLQEMYRAKLASTELFTILGGFVSSLLFLLALTLAIVTFFCGSRTQDQNIWFIGNLQEGSGVRTGWFAVIVAEVVALVAASTVHRVCITTCFLFSAVILYEINKLSAMALAKSESKPKRH